jgi:hypothetical protein
MTAENNREVPVCSTQSGYFFGPKEEFSLELKISYYSPTAGAR